MERDYYMPANAAHRIPQMICLEYLPSARAKKWRVAFRMHPAGRDNMEKTADEMKTEEKWHAWRIVTENIVS